MLLGADPIASTPICGLLTATSTVVSLANDPRYSARRNQNVKIRWGNDPEPVTGPGVPFLVPEVGQSPGIGTFDTLEGAPQVQPIRIDPPDITDAVIRESGARIAERQEQIAAARLARRRDEHRAAQERRRARLQAIEDAEREAREIAEAERLRLEAEAAERERARAEVVAKLQFDPQKEAERLAAELQSVAHHTEAERALLALEITQIRAELAAGRQELAALRDEMAVARDDLRRAQNNLLAIQTATELLFSGD